MNPTPPDYKAKSQRHSVQLEKGVALNTQEGTLTDLPQNTFITSAADNMHINHQSKGMDCNVPDPSRQEDSPPLCRSQNYPPVEPLEHSPHPTSGENPS
jgi:hypothetical protein